MDTRLEKPELSLAATQELVLEQLAQFKEKIVQLEQTHNADIRSLRRDLALSKSQEEVFIVSPIKFCMISEMSSQATVT